MPDSPTTPADNNAQKPPVVVKKYANRRLYNTETSSYITLDNLADMIRAGRDFVVYDAKSGEDITRGVLTQIIVEEESKGTSMLPTNFLRQLIGFYGDSLQGVVPRYLEQAMSNFAHQQQQMRQVMQQTFSPFLPMGVEEMGRQNIALMERAMSMFNPFHRPGDPSRPADATMGTHDGGQTQGASPPERQSQAGEMPASDLLAPAAPQSTHDLDALKHEVESLRAQLAIARAEAVVSRLPETVASLTAPNIVADSHPVISPTAAPIPLAIARKARPMKKPV